MQRSPLIFWLLVAATLAADGVAISWFCVSTFDRAGNLYFALVCSQISAVCIGSCFSSIRHRWWMGPLAASMTAAVITTGLLHFRQDREDPYQQILLYLSFWLLQAALLLAMLWLLCQTPYASRWGRPSGRGNWQFSTGHILIIMTTLAILLVILRLSKEAHQFWVELAVWIANNVTLALAALIIYAVRWHALLRLGAIVGASVVLAFGVAAITRGNPDSFPVNIIQAILLFVWLAFGEIAPARAVFDDDGDCQ